MSLQADTDSNIHGIRCVEQMQTTETHSDTFKQSVQDTNKEEYKDFVIQKLINKLTEEKKFVPNDTSTMQIIKDCFIVFACCAIVLLSIKLFYNFRMGRNSHLHSVEQNTIYFQNKENQDLRQSSTTLNTVITNKDDSISVKN